MRKPRRRAVVAFFILRKLYKGEKTLEEDIWKKAKSNAVNVMQNSGWVQWIHEGTNPAMTSTEKTFNIALSILSLGKHCAMCMNINGCCFPRNNMPEYPLHPNCHCKLMPIDRVWATAECPIGKFENYILILLKIKAKKSCLKVGDMLK